MRYLRANGYKIYIVTGGGQDFVRVYSERVYGIPPEQVVGTAGGTKYGYDKNGKPFLTKEPKLLLERRQCRQARRYPPDDRARPYAAFGNSTGDRQMLEYTKAGDGARLAMLVLHDDDKREYAYGPAQDCQTPRLALSPGALRRGEEGGLDHHQHEARLEANLCVRVIASSRIDVNCTWLLSLRSVFCWRDSLPRASHLASLGRILIREASVMSPGPNNSAAWITCP